jgi:hypothetical protein
VGGQHNIRRCAPDGAVAGLSATLFGNGFWRSQLVAIKAERKIAEKVGSSAG